MSLAFHLRYLIKYLAVFMTVVHTYFYKVISNPTIRPLYLELLMAS